MIVPGTIEQEYLDVADAGRYIGVAKAIPGDKDPEGTLKRQLQRIYTMVYRKQIPYLKRGKRVYFEKRALDEWMRSKRPR